MNHVAYSPDGAFVATASQDGTERVWEASSGTLRLELNNHHGRAFSVEFDPTSRLLVSSGTGPAVVVSDVMTGVPVTILDGPRARVTDVHFDKESRRIVGSSWDHNAWVWDATPRYHRWSSPVGDETYRSSVNPQEDHRYVATASAHFSTRIWDTAHDSLIAELPRVIHSTNAVIGTFAMVSPSGDRAAVAVGNVVAVYELPTGRLVRTVSHPAPVSTFVLNDTGRTLVSGDTEGSLRVMQEDRDVLALAAPPGRIDALEVTCDGRVVVAGQRGYLRVYDPERSTFVALEPSNRVQAFRLSADGRRLITIPETSIPKSPVLWDLQSNRVIAHLDGHSGQVFSARFVRGDREILTAASDGSARLWDGTNGSLRQVYLANDQYLLDAALSPDGSMVVAGGGDGMLRFWETDSGLLVWTMRAHRFGVYGLHFEGNDLVTRGHTGEVSRWTIPRTLLPQQLATMADVTRCLALRLEEATGRLIQQVSCNSP